MLSLPFSLHLIARKLNDTVQVLDFAFDLNDAPEDRGLVNAASNSAVLRVQHEMVAI